VDYLANPDKQKYLYFLHGTKDESLETLEDIFNNGLKSYRGNSLNSTMTPLSKELQEVGLTDLIKNYTSQHDFKSTYVIKIPIQYMAQVVHRDGRVDTPLPFWKDSGNRDVHGRKTAVFTPHLIQGVYNENIGFVTNTNYSPIFNPNGLQYSDEQIAHFGAQGWAEWSDYAMTRNKASFDTLLKHDENRGTFDKAIEEYKQIYDEKPTKHFSAEQYRGKISTSRNIRNLMANSDRSDPRD